MATLSGTCLGFRTPLNTLKKPQCFNLLNLSASTTTRFRTSRFRISCSAKPETVAKVCEIVKKQLALTPETELTPDSKFSALGADSLDTVEIVMGLEEEFDITVEEDNSQNITTVQEAADLIQKLIDKKTADAA